MKTIVITGSTDGLGKALAYRFANLKYRVVLHGRNQKKGNKLIEEIKKKSGNQCLYYYNADFEKTTEIYRLGNEIINNHPTIDILINNAGIGHEEFRRETSNGVEIFFQVNFLAHYILSMLLVSALSHKKTSKIINIASSGQLPISFKNFSLKESWSSKKAYCQSKFALVLFTYQEANFFIERNIQIVALHPASYMPTKMIGNTPSRDTLEDGIDAVLNLMNNKNNINGSYFYKLEKLKAMNEVYESIRWEQLLIHIQPLLLIEGKKST